METKTVSLSQVLIVPMDVRAFCVGDGDQDAVDHFTGITLDFSKITAAKDEQGAAIISRENDVYRDSRVQPLEPLAEGIHLHWNLPRALTHGQTEEGSDITFPLVPNRWLVTRIVDVPDPFTSAKSWVVESDHIDLNPPDGNASVTIFVGYDHEENNGQPYRYLGRVVPAVNWTEPEPGTSQLKSLTQSDLTAMQAGDPLFASFYPNCRNIFGLHDDLAGVDDNSTVMYVIVGWYSNPGNDPLHDGFDSTALSENFGWKLPDGTTGSFNKSLFVGQIQGIRWNRSTAYVYPDNPIEVAVGVGSSGADALSAWIGGAIDDPAHRETFEEMLTAYQVGVLSELYQPHPDRMAEVLDQLHASSFTHVIGGTVWSVVPTANPIGSVPLADLPSGLSAKLSKLNSDQENYDIQVAIVDALRRQLYLDWFRCGLTKLDYDAEQQQFEDRWNDYRQYVAESGDLLFNTTISQGGKVLEELDARKATLQQSKQDAAEAAAAHGWALKSLVAPWFWRPNDPVVVLSGPDTIHRLQGKDADTPVLCRSADTLISSISVRGVRIEGPASQQGTIPPEATPVPVQVWDEAALLDAAYLAQVTEDSRDDIAQGLKRFLDERKENDIITGHDGVLPDAQAAQWWTDKNPWLPLFMWWNVNYYPAPATCYYPTPNDNDSNCKDLPADLPSDYVTGQFTLQDDGTMKPKGWSVGGEAWSFFGQSILTPFATNRLIDALQKDTNAGDLADDIRKAIDDLQNTSMLYQGLTGFTDALLMLGQIPQLGGEILDNENSNITINDDDGLFDSVSKFVQNARRLASYPNTQFVPLRAGFLSMNQDLTLIVDSFGQPRKVDITAFRCDPEMRTTDSEERLQAYLPPRFSQPMRLKFDFLSAATDTEQATLLSSPICGWLLFNHLDNALAIYDDSGTPRGMIDHQSEGLKWMGVPGPTYGDDFDTAMTGANSHLVDLTRALLGDGADQLQKLSNCVDQISQTTTGSIPQDPALSILISRPIVVVQAVIDLELLGIAAVNQQWAAFDKDVNNFAFDPKAFIAGRVNGGTTKIQMEVILGNQGRFMDGLFGFYVGDGNGSYDFDHFYSPASSEVQGVLPPRITLSVDSGRVRLLMLVDPLSQIHAVSGMLPTETLTIPPDLTAPFLVHLAVTFPVRPVLADNAGFDLPLPTESGYSWSWIQHDGDNWTTLPLAKAPSSAATRYIPQRIYSGWLKLIRQDKGN